MSIITLLTDFGSLDFFAAAMKAAILSINSGANIVDITHESPPQDLRAGAFNLLAVYRDFPPGTIHVGVVDPGVGSARRGLVIDCAGQYFVGPDNGLFSWMLDREGVFRAVELSNEKFFRHPVSRTFQGRDVFAPVAGALSKGVAVAEFGPVITDPIRLEALAPGRVGDGRIEATIIHIDRFGNCITNLTREHFDAGGKLVINDRQLSSFREFFSDGGFGGDEPFTYFGSAGFLEIAVQNGSAAKVLGAHPGDPLVVLRP